MLELIASALGIISSVNSILRGQEEAQSAADATSFLDSIDQRLLAIQSLLSNAPENEGMLLSRYQELIETLKSSSLYRAKLRFLRLPDGSVRVVRAKKPTVLRDGRGEYSELFWVAD